MLFTVQSFSNNAHITDFACPECSSYSSYAREILLKEDYGAFLSGPVSTLSAPTARFVSTGHSRLWPQVLVLGEDLDARPVRAKARDRRTHLAQTLAKPEQADRSRRAAHAGR